ncbi:Camphor resistance CrcB protein [Cellulomonas flavigena DSM 20109]|uniref:Fluoride-specific ion channel FluC n=1 Tax=Cellulomonas flavigena (strain ATCC 482 / DSM 20109 / BCRC 11376 / JCM 18109 / NBRC 3775 / NCIMB 8073 / NRS 134) TaxID=446466 RepID=D5UGH6_CELFN|nr:CrcB family protein [Cellulomonas flavigena]ADG73159.1 Camphor resistance CrcB protein [Cellulomonas flavigena DSM 20109]
MAALTPPGTAPGAPGDDTPLALPAGAALVAAGGTLGVLVRALLTSPAGPGAWPWATFVVNVTGSLVLGALLAVLQRGPDVGQRRAVRLVVGTGVLGGFTTYSTFALEVHRLVSTGHVVTGVVYALGSVVLGVAAAGVGIVVAGRVLAARVPSREGHGPGADGATSGTPDGPGTPGASA